MVIGDSSNAGFDLADFEFESIKTFPSAAIVPRIKATANRVNLYSISASSSFFC